jgi:predicted secreted protein
MSKSLPYLCGLLLAVALPAAAAEPQQPLFDTVSLSTRAEAEVDNDRIETVLYAEREGSDPAKLADAVNREMDWALRQLKPVAAIHASTPAYRSSPIYQQGHITGWRVRQTLRLVSTEPKTMSAMLGKLQARLQLQGVSFVLSPQRRRREEEKLTREALTRFTDRAAMIAKQLGRGGYRLVSVQVNGADNIRPTPRLAAMRSEAAVAPPRLEAGRSQVRVTVSGTIQLKD